MSLLAWAFRNSGAAVARDWFEQRFDRARALLPLANFDTVIPIECAETVTVELTDVAGVADATPAAAVTGGAIAVDVGDAAITPSQGRLNLVGSGSHVGTLNAEYWYMAALVKYVGPTDGAQVAETGADAVALWSDDDNRVTIGVLGNVSGGSTTQFVGRVNNAGSNFTSLGPLLGGEPAPWHLFEAWFNVVANTVHFAIDGVEFAATIDGANLPAVAAKWGPIVQRSAIGDQATVQYEKATVIVTSPTVGGA